MSQFSLFHSARRWKAMEKEMEKEMELIRTHIMTQVLNNLICM